MGNESQNEGMQRLFQSRKVKRISEECKVA
jgi:hypothetical protein